MVSEDGAIYGYNNILVVHLFQKGGDSRAMNPARLDTSSHMYRVAEQSFREKKGKILWCKLGVIIAFS